MSNKRYDIYIGCADKYNKEKENVEDFNQDLLKNILTKYTVHYSITKQAGGYSHYDGTYVIEDSCDALTRPIEAGASCSREVAFSVSTGYPRVPRGSF